MQGMELTIRLLEADNKIRIVRTNDGTEQIHHEVPNSDRTINH